jgi:hypothetical protein
MPCSIRLSTKETAIFLWIWCLGRTPTYFVPVDYPLIPDASATCRNSCQRVSIRGYKYAKTQGIFAWPIMMIPIKPA